MAFAAERPLRIHANEVEVCVNRFEATDAPQSPKKADVAER